MRPTTLLVLALTLMPAASAAQKPTWRWVLGKLGDRTADRDYRAFAKRMFDYYQKRKMLVGKLVKEADLPAGAQHVVFLGPAPAFRDPQNFGLPLTVADDGSLRIAGVRLKNARTGVFLRNAQQTRFLYTGRTLRGFKDIFSVPTGGKACTIVVNGEVEREGSYSNGRLRLESRGFLPEFPTPAALKRVRLPEGALSVSPVYTDNKRLAPKLRQRLRELTKDNNVLFVGESHWNVGVNRLFNRILEELLDMRDVRAVFLELNYSFSGFFDHYATLDDAKAAKFLEEVCHPLIGNETLLETLDIVRRHNAKQKQRVHIACLDMEWNPGAVMGLIRRAREFPFLTDEFRANVKQNLRDTQLHKGSHERRQKAIIRNITRFHGELLGKGLAVFKGGGFHAVKRPVEGESFDRDAEYLHQTHEATKGRVTTMWLKGLGYGFAEVADLNPRTHLTSATKFHRFVARFQKSTRNGKASTDAFYLLDGKLRLADWMMARAAHDLGADAVWIEDIDDTFRRRLRANSAAYRLDDYDTTIYVLRSQLEPTRLREYRR